MPLVLKVGRISSTAALQALVWVWAALTEGALLPPTGFIKLLWTVFSDKGQKTENLNYYRTKTFPFN